LVAEPVTPVVCSNGGFRWRSQAHLTFGFQVQKQISAFARRFWHRAVDVLQTLFKALNRSCGMSARSLDRATRVARAIVSSPSMRELLYYRHLHQVSAMSSAIELCRHS
jgi:hypothetical protein